MIKKDVFPTFIKIESSFFSIEIEIIF
jgi:hypothetical protein